MGAESRNGSDSGKKQTMKPLSAAQRNMKERAIETVFTKGLGRVVTVHIYIYVISNMRE